MILNVDNNFRQYFKIYYNLLSTQKKLFAKDA